MAPSILVSFVDLLTNKGVLLIELMQIDVETPLIPLHVPIDSMINDYISMTRMTMQSGAISWVPALKALSKTSDAIFKENDACYHRQ